MLAAVKDRPHSPPLAVNASPNILRPNFSTVVSGLRACCRLTQNEADHRSLNRGQPATLTCQRRRCVFLYSPSSNTDSPEWVVPHSFPADRSTDRLLPMASQHGWGKRHGFALRPTLDTSPSHRICPLPAHGQTAKWQLRVILHKPRRKNQKALITN